MKIIDVKPPNEEAIEISNKHPFVLIAGSCALESHDCARSIANAVREITQEIGIPYIAKFSFDKANRTSIDAKRGVGLEESLKTFEYIRKWMGIPVLTDVHEFWQCDAIKPVVDIIQIPALLCRQTDLIVAAAETGCVVNLKKGQFMAPWEMKYAVEKVESVKMNLGRIMLTERGTSFGYNRLVSDMLSIPIMEETGYPVIFDATHSVQKPGGEGSSSGGNWKDAIPLAKAAVAVGVAGIFMEVHHDPERAHSDGPNSIPLIYLADILKQLKEIDNVVKNVSVS